MPEKDGRPTTKAAIDMHHRTHNADALDQVPDMAGDSAYTNDRLESGTDQYYVSPEERAEWGIREDEVVTWPRDGRQWGRPGGEGYDRTRQVLRQNPGSRTITDPKTGDYVGQDDLILLVKPREEVEKAQKRDEERRREWQRRIEEKDLEGDFARLKAQGPEALREYARTASAALNNLLGPGSETHRLAYADALARMKQRHGSHWKEKIAEEEEHFRRGSRRMDVSERAARRVEEQERADRLSPSEREARGSGGAGASGGTVYSLPRTITPKNLRKA